MRYTIFGAGAIGGAIGGLLFEAGHDVTLIARGAHHEALRRAGLVLRTPERQVTLAVPVVDRLERIEWADDHAVIVAVKSQDTASALDALAAAAPPGIAVLCAQNGVENERMALRRFARVYAVCVMLPANHVTPGCVDVHSAPVAGILDIGRYPAGADEMAERVAGDLDSSGFSSRAEPAVMRNKHAKLLMNLGNALDAACGQGADYGDLYAAARAEGRACFAAAGIDAASDEEDRARRGDLVRMRPVEGERRGGGSSWQSLARGTGSIEADHLNGEIALLGRLHGVPTPVNALLQRVANRLAAERRPPGSVSPHELRAQLG